MFVSLIEIEMNGGGGGASQPGSSFSRLMASIIHQEQIPSQGQKHHPPHLPPRRRENPSNSIYRVRVGTGLFTFKVDGA